MEAKKIKFLISCMLFLLLVAMTIFFINIFHGIEVRHEVVKDIYAAVVSIVLGSIVTLSLLYAQSLHEEQRNKGAEIFKQKIATFNEFIDALGNYLQDGSLSQEEIRLILLKRSKVSMHLNNKNRIIFDNALSRIKFDLFLYDEWDNQDYQSMNNIFEEISRAFVSELYGSKGVYRIDYFDVAGFLKFTKFKIDYPRPMKSPEEFLEAIRSGRKVLFSTKSKNENQPDKYYSFDLSASNLTIIDEAHSYLMNLINNCKIQIDVEFSLNEKRVDNEIYILNPKIIYSYGDKKIMTLGVTNRNRVNLFLYNEDGGLFKKMVVGDFEEGVDKNTVSRYLPDITIAKFLNKLIH